MIPKKRMSLNKKSLTHTPSTAWCLVKYMFKHFSAFVIIISGLQKYDMRASQLLHQLHTTWNTLPPHCISATATKRRRRNRTQSESNKHLSNNHRISTILASAINTTPMHHWRSYYHLQTMLGIIIEWQTVLWFNLCGALCRLVIKWAPSPRGHKMNYIADILEDVSLPSSLSAPARPPSSSSGTAQQSLPSTSAAPGMVNKSKFVIGGISIFG